MDDEVTIKQIPLEFFREKQAAPSRGRAAPAACDGAPVKRGSFASEVDDGECAATLEKRADWSESDLTGRPRGGFESCELTQIRACCL